MRAEIDHATVTYTLRDGPGGELTIRNAGTLVTLTTRGPTTVALRPREPLLPEPAQPPGREPQWNYRRLPAAEAG